MANFKVLFVGAEDEENLAIRYLAAVLEREGNSVEIAACSKKSDFANVLKAVKKSRPGLIAVSMPFQSLLQCFLN